MGYTGIKKKYAIQTVFSFRYDWLYEKTHTHTIPKIFIKYWFHFKPKIPGIYYFKNIIQSKLLKLGIIYHQTSQH